ncbi:MAG: SEC-C domain-containing protein [Armatimonadetes bacterium]|nr:preprotein translocase subunit SecA [Armatimonadota bacterium]MBS1702635.1 SEC-C domain-containing protein [Armatimonadota bacterium]
MLELLRKLFDTSKRDIETIQPLVDKISAFEANIENLSDEELKDKCYALRHRARGGEKGEELTVETFACVREVSKRTLGMRHFDVQLVGGLVLHHGRIAEMKTGEGKTLVAAAPLVLNALGGRGAHLVTVNDYLARRDAVWMGPIYHFFGLSVGIIQGQSEENDELGGSYRYEPGADIVGDPRYLNLVPCSRRDAYSCDITYGTNHEFGFDYLRDNMAFSEEDLVMSELHYAIIDEVDSILIDEARTPHIISGPSMEDVSTYKTIDGLVKQLTPEEHWTADKKNHSATLTEEGMDRLEEMLGIDNIAADVKLLHYINASVKAHGLFTRDIDYVVRSGEVVIVDENTGRMMFGRRFSDGLHQALEAKEGVRVQNESQTVATITFQNLFRLYEKLAGMTGTAKTEEDEFRKIYGLDVVSVPTHRPKQREDHGDSIYKTHEAKFRAIGYEILRLYTKQQPVLVGTRSIEMSEIVSNRLEADMLQKLVITKRLQSMNEVTKELKGDQAKDARRFYEMNLAELNMSEVAMLLGQMGLPTSITDANWTDWCLKEWGLEESNREFLLEALKHGIPHNILNAKFHEQEAVIIAEAGRKGAVTIATNMAGRGVDILLGGRVEDDLVRMARDQVAVAHDGVDEYGETFKSYRRGGHERAAPPLPLSDQERREQAEIVRALGGLFILGTERHESRRIDNQLRGRSGRQGDPGESKFYVSLEDQLWKIFNPNMLENPMLKAWPPMEEVNANFLSRMIQKTQERIENHYFEARKNVLEYDDVLNAQREHIYGLRREVLLGKDVREELLNYVDEVVADICDNAWMIEENGDRVFDHSVLFEDLNEIFPLVDYATIADLEKHEPGEPVISFVQDIARKAYDEKVEQAGEAMPEAERFVMLRAVNDKWMEHLQLIEYIREGIGLRGYGQVDPLVAYKKETYDTFQSTLKNIREHASKMIFHVRVQAQREDEELAQALTDAFPDGDTPKEASKAEPGSLPFPGNVDPKKVGRNDTCPCGSGLKFKSCHYSVLRQQGVI